MEKHLDIYVQYYVITFVSDLR